MDQTEQFGWQLELIAAGRSPAMKRRDSTRLGITFIVFEILDS